MLCGSDSLLLELHTAVFSTVRSPVGCVRHGQATLYLFQKHQLYWEQQYNVCGNGITADKVKYFALFEFLLVKILNYFEETAGSCGLRDNVFGNVHKTFV